MLTALTGNTPAAQGVLRHKSINTTAIYKEETPEATLNGMKLLESAAKRK